MQVLYCCIVLRARFRRSLGVCRSLGLRPATGPLTLNRDISVSERCLGHRDRQLQTSGLSPKNWDGWSAVVLTSFSLFHVSFLMLARTPTFRKVGVQLFVLFCTPTFKIVAPPLHTLLGCSICAFVVSIRNIANIINVYSAASRECLKFCCCFIFSIP